MNMDTNLLGIMLKCRFWFSRCGVGSEICISFKLLDENRCQWSISGTPWSCIASSVSSPQQVLHFTKREATEWRDTHNVWEVTKRTAALHSSHRKERSAQKWESSPHFRKHSTQIHLNNDCQPQNRTFQNEQNWPKPTGIRIIPFLVVDSWQ